MADFQASIVRLAAGLVEHSLEAAMGERTLKEASEILGNIVGQDTAETIKNFLEQGRGTERVIEAFRAADHEFTESIDDDDLRQAIASRPLAALPHLTQLAEKLPSTLDDQGLLDALRMQFAEDWGKQLSSAQLDRAAYVYRACLDKALAIECGQILTTILRKVDRVEQGQTALRSDTKQMLNAQRSFGAKLDSLIQERFGSSGSFPVQAIRVPQPDSMPLAPSPFLIRHELIADLRNELSVHPWLALVDGPGKGKSQLAISIAQSPEQIKWISLRDKGSLASGHLRDQLAVWLAQVLQDPSVWFQYLEGLPLEEIVSRLGRALTSQTLLILDDLPDPVDDEALYKNIEGAVSVLISSNVRLITTSQRPLPPFVENRFHGSIKPESCPAFSVDEIETLLRLAGSPDSFRNDEVAIWTRAVTQGHPVLVAATIKWLQRATWRYSPEMFDALVSGEPLKPTLEYSRRQMLTHLDAASKQMLYRLSIVGESFTRATALEIGNIRPRVSNPGDTLDSLIGPWLERLRDEELSVTPLLSDSGKENLEFTTQRAVHRLLFRKLTAGGVIDISKASNVLMHLWQAHDYKQFGHIVLMLLVSVETEQQAKYISWATGYFLGVPWPDELTSDLRILIRSAQVKVAAMGKHNIARLNEDLTQLISQADPHRDLPALLGAYVYTGIASRDLPLEITIPRSFSLLHLLHENPTERRSFFDDESLPHVALTVWGQGTRSRSFEETILFLEEAAKLSRDEQAYLFAEEAFALEASIHLIDAVWMAETSKKMEDQNWDDVLNKLHHIQLLPIVEEHTALEVGCVRAQAIVLAEHKGDIRQAISVLDSLPAVAVGDARFILDYSKGCLASDAGLSNDALHYFIDADQAPGNMFQYFRLDNTRRLAIERGRQADWEKAKSTCIASIKKFGDIHDAVFKKELRWDRAEMLGELAFIQWNFGHWKQVSGAYYAYVMQLVGETGDLSDPRYMEAFFKAGHGLGWFLAIAHTGNPPTATLDGQSYAPVYPGLFGVRRPNLGASLPAHPSRAILLTQYALLAFRMGSERIAWRANTEALKHYQAENLEAHPFLANIYPQLSILEMTYGNEGLAFDYALQAIKFWAAGRANLSREARERSVLDGALDFSLSTMDDLQTAERHALQLIFVPMYLNLWGGGLSATVTIRKLRVLEQLCMERGASLNYKDDWPIIFHRICELADYQAGGAEAQPEFEVFEDKTTFEILKLLTSSVQDRIGLEEAFTRQVRAMQGLSNYGGFCSAMLPGCGRILYKFWSRVSKTQRFALHDPEGFAEQLRGISPDLGSRTILDVIKATRRALTMGITDDLMNQLERLMAF